MHLSSRWEYCEYSTNIWKLNLLERSIQERSIQTYSLYNRKANKENKQKTEIKYKAKTKTKQKKIFFLKWRQKSDYDYCKISNDQYNSSFQQVRSQANVWKAYPCSFDRWHGWVIINIKKVGNENVFMNIFNISMRCWNSKKGKQRMDVFFLRTFCKTTLPSPLYLYWTLLQNCILWQKKEPIQRNILQ